ncbi:hypothetical protein [Sphingomonas sp. RS2018]
MIHRILPAAAALALLSVAACKGEPEVVDSRAPDPLAEQLKNAPEVELPPAVKASVTFRCQPGNSLVYVDFFDGNKMAIVRSERGGTPTTLAAAESGQPFTGGGYTVVGTPASIKYTAPGKPELACKA